MNRFLGMNKFLQTYLMAFFVVSVAACSGTGGVSSSSEALTSSSQATIESSSSTLEFSSSTVESSSATAESSSSLAALSSSSMAVMSSSSSLGPNLIPTVSFVYPENGAVLPYRSSVDVTVNAQDSDGEIVNAVLYLNDQVVASITQAPFKWPASVLSQLRQLNPAVYSLRVVVTDNRGATQSASSSFEVLEQNNFPAVSFVMPAANLNLLVGANMDVIANAADSDGTITKVSLFINDQLVGDDFNYPYEWFHSQQSKLAQMAAGSYEFKVTATDNKGGVTSAKQTLTISTNAVLNAGDPARGKQQYRQNCMSCHGQFGEGYNNVPNLVPIKSSYSVNGQSYSLYAVINDFMPKDFAVGCTGQCARNVATYIREQLVAESQAHNLLVGDAATGKIEYQLQCSGCHGERGMGGSEEVFIFPLKTDNGYKLESFYVFSDVSLFSLIDIGMPIGPKGYPEGYTESCQGQCAADVEAYLYELEADLTPEEFKIAQIARGKSIYLGQCSGCHSSDGKRSGIIPLSAQQLTPATLDNSDRLFVYNRDAMPPGNPSACAGQCAQDVTLYIREVLNK